MRRLLTILFAVLTVTYQSALADPPTDYYKNVDESTAASLRASLHTIISGHVRFPYSTSGTSKTDTWDILEEAQQDPENPDNVLDLYRNASYPKFGRGNDFYQREHTWPKSYGFPGGGRGGGLGR